VIAASSLLLLLPFLIIGGSAPGHQEKPPEPVLRVNLLDNGNFADRNDAQLDVSGLRPIPWWRSSRGMEQVVAMPGGGVALRTKDDEWAEQPIACYAPLACSWILRGRASGAGGVVSLSGGMETGVTLIVDGPPPGESVPFEFGQTKDQGELVPRLKLRLQGPKGGSVLWTDLSFEVDLPCPAAEELRAEILELLREIVAPWLERALDDLGPKKTGFLCHDFDAVTGATLSTSDGGIHPLWEQLNLALQVAEVPEWRAALERFLDDWLTLCLDPATGLPRAWDCKKDEPVVDHPPGDLALPLGFLIDVAESGPERFRARARAAAEKIAETVLARGVLPDGTIAASYFPSDGRANTSVLELRRFDLLARLARLEKIRTDPRFLRASEELRSSFEFDHVWWGTWDRIDPGFDDEFGNYGARAASIALADPQGKEGAAFRAIALDGWRYYAPLWRDAARLGGNIAADQVRCWSLLADLAQVEPSEESSISEHLHLAARSHFKSKQYDNGAWGDVTSYRYDPKTALQVGDYPGVPQNLLNGIASIYSDGLGLRSEELRAMFTAILRSSVKEYRRTYGFLLERTEHKGENSARGTLRMLPGLVKMMRML
jgi:hypothetical protein